MLRITKKTDYAIRVLLALARRAPHSRVPSAEIQQEMLIPAALSQRIIAQLARGGLIYTHPGRDGGIQLSRPPAEISLLEVVELFEGPVLLSECLGRDEDCPFQAHCPVRKRWGRLQAILRSEMAAIRFDELAADAATVPLTVTA